MMTESKTILFVGYTFPEINQSQNKAQKDKLPQQKVKLHLKENERDLHFKKKTDIILFKPRRCSMID